VNPTSIRIESVSFACPDFRYRTPIKFGGIALDRVTLLDVTLDVRTTQGRRAQGFGSMPLGNVWSFPSRVLSYDDTLAAMKALASRVQALYAACPQSGHPVDLTWALEHDIFRAAASVTQELQLAEPMPRLAALVVASAFDAALHDAYGKVHGRSCYGTYGPDFLPHDVGHYLGTEFRGLRLDHVVSPQPRQTMPLYHLVGALDALEDGDLSRRLNDGLPETLGQWIDTDGLTHLKIKLNGDDLAWDVDRVARVERVAADVQHRRGITSWLYSLDFNERCADVGYLLEFLHRLQESSRSAFERVQYIEQPTARDLKANRQNRMHEAARLRPVVIDESLVDLESLQLAREMGYTGVALKACKGQTQSLLLAAAAQHYGLFLCVQDLTCPGASLIHSAGLAAHVHGVAAIEANARQYVPAANAGWRERFPGLFQVHNGVLVTGEITGPGLGAV
jgi:L-alanine-DL-glutamate epimerase-like enolase superfamily enzyme